MASEHEKPLMMLSLTTADLKDLWAGLLEAGLKASNTSGRV